MSNKHTDKSQGDSSFREWLSDNLRYLVLIIAALLIVVVIVMVTTLVGQYRNKKPAKSGQNPASDIVIMSESITEASTQSGSEKAAQKATEKATERQTEKGTEKATEKTTEKVTEKTGTKSTEKTAAKAVQSAASSGSKAGASTVSGIGTADLDSATSKSTTKETTAPSVKTSYLAGGSSSVKGNASSVTNMDTGSSVGNYTAPAVSASSSASGSSADTSSSSGSSDQIVILPGSSASQEGDNENGADEAQPEQPVQQETSAPSTATITSACYIRSEPGYGDNIIGSLHGGESVNYYGIVEGWAKIETGGVTGYIGPKFIG